MAVKYWVGGGSNTNWNSSPVTNWANSSGGAGNQTAPATGDSVVFDGNSGTGAVVLNVAISLTGFNCTNSKNSFSGGSAITLSAGNLILPDGVGASWAATSVFTLTATSGTQQIKCNGWTLGGLTLNGSGGTFQAQDNLNVINGTTTIGTITLTAGTLDCQSFAVAASAFASTGSAARALKGSGQWTLATTSSGGSTTWNVGTGTNLDLSLFSSNIVVNINISGGKTLAFGTYTIQGTVTITAASGTGSGLTLSGSTTFSSLVTINGIAGMIFSWSSVASFNGGLKLVGPMQQVIVANNNTVAGFDVSGWISFAIANTATLTLSGAVSIVGTAAAPIGIQNQSYGGSSSSLISMASGTPTLQWCSFRDVAFTGGATFVANNSFDLGHNSGITINPPAIGVSRARLHLGA